MGQPDQKRLVGTKVDEVIRAIVELGGTYPDAVQALQQANKDFDLMLYPQSRHGIGGAHYQRLQREFMDRHLKPQP